MDWSAMNYAVVATLGVLIAGGLLACVMLFFWSWGRDVYYDVFTDM